MPASPEKTRAVSIRASRNYILALGKVAENMKTTMGDLMREVIDERLGKDIAPYLDALDSVDVGINNFQSEEKNKKKRRVASASAAAKQMEVDNAAN